MHLAQFPEAFVVPAGDEGGPMTHGGNCVGTNVVTGVHTCALTINTGDSINVRLGTTSFLGKLQLYGPTGALLDAQQANTDDLISYTAKIGRASSRQII